MNGDQGPLTEKDCEELIKVIKDTIGEEAGIVCIIFDKKTGEASLVSDAGPRLVMLRLLDAVASIVDGFEEGERVGVIH